MKVQLNKLLILLAFILFCIPNSFTQERLKFSIVNFAVDPFDISAKDSRYEKYDGNGDRYAIIKVTSNNPDDNLKDFNFNFGNMRHIVEEHEGILWIYVQRNAKLVTITRNGYAPINKYDLHTTIESGKNYIMSISSEDKKILTQMVQFNVKPANSEAVVMIKSFKGESEEIFGMIDATGAVAKSLEYGTYSYKVFADNYLTSEGRFTLGEKSRTHIENVELSPNFSDITLKVDADADIYVNGEKKGTRQWTGVLKADNYHIECRQANHKPSSRYLTVTKNDNRTINLVAPEPILGTVAIVSNPLGADIIIDGTNYGKTPRNLELLIGNHNLVLSKENYKTEKQSIDVKEKQTTNVNITLGQITKATIKCNPTYATLYIDDNYKGSTPYEYEGEVGTHKVKLFRDGYKPIEKKIYFGNEDIINFSLQKQLVRKKDFYVAIGAEIGSSMCVSASLGTHIANFNIELDYSYCFQKSPTIYWNYTGDDNDYTPDACTYSPSLILGGKLGYGVIVGTRFKITPQIGYRFTKLSEDSSGSSHINGAYCSSATVGLRAYCAISSHFGISLTPEYAIGVSKSEGFRTLSEVTSKIKNMGEGFNANISLVFTF